MVDRIPYAALGVAGQGCGLARDAFAVLKIGHRKFSLCQVV
jgi:hypothetical protein